MTAAPALKARDYWFDNAKALLILSVVVGHFATSSQINRQEWVNDIAKFFISSICRFYDYFRAGFPGDEWIEKRQKKRFASFCFLMARYSYSC